MFWDDIKLVTELVGKYGLRRPFVDLGGQDRPTIADYDLTIATGDQEARYVELRQRPFDHIDPEYFVINPEKGHPPIEELPKHMPGLFGTVTCLNVIEHVEDPFKVYEAMKALMKPDSLLIIETVFSFPYHPSPHDYWRFSPEALRLMGARSGLKVLECDWRMNILADKGILEKKTRTPQEIKSVYAVYTNGVLGPMPPVRFSLPQRVSNHPGANRIISGG